MCYYAKDLHQNLSYALESQTHKAILMLEIYQTLEMTITSIYLKCLLFLFLFVLFFCSCVLITPLPLSTSLVFQLKKKKKKLVKKVTFFNLKKKKSVLISKRLKLWFYQSLLKTWFSIYIVPTVLTSLWNPADSL